MPDRLLGPTPPDPAPLYQKTDHWFQRATATLLGEVPCRLGCTSCCIGPFPITLLDVHTLQQGLAGLPPDHASVSNSAPSSTPPQWRPPSHN
jgi:hypothetical protein